MACSVAFGIVLCFLIFAMVVLVGVEVAPWIKYHGLDRAYAQTVKNMFNTIFVDILEEEKDGYNGQGAGDIFGTVIGDTAMATETKKGLLFTCTGDGTEECYRNQMDHMETYEIVAVVLMMMAGNLTIIALAASCGICCNCCRNKIPTVMIAVCSALAMFMTLISAIYYITEADKLLHNEYKLQPGVFLAIIYGPLMLFVTMLTLAYLFTKGDLVIYEPKIEITHPLFAQAQTQLVSPAPKFAEYAA